MSSITELANEITNEIDIVDATGIVRLLRQTDAQMFYGWRHHPSLYVDKFNVALTVAA